MKCHIHLYYVKKLLLEFVDVIQFTPGASLLDLISKIMFSYVLLLCPRAQFPIQMTAPPTSSLAPPTLYLASSTLVRFAGVSVFVGVKIVIFHVDLEK